MGGGAANIKELATEPVRQIIGVVGDVRAGSIAQDPGPMMFLPFAQMPDALTRVNAGVGPDGLGYAHDRRAGNGVEADPRRHSRDDGRARDERPEHGRHRLARIPRGNG